MADPAMAQHTGFRWVGTWPRMPQPLPIPPADGQAPSQRRRIAQPVPSIAPAGLEALPSPEACLVYRLPVPDMHGREVLRRTPLELLDRLAHLVPPPRIHRHRYHGVLAPNARLRSTVVSMGRPEPDEIPVDTKRLPSSDLPSHPVAPPDRFDEPGPTGPTTRSRSSRMLWAQLVARGHRREALVAKCSRSCAPPAVAR
jgi:hypothetical protein